MGEDRLADTDRPELRGLDRDFRRRHLQVYPAETTGVTTEQEAIKRSMANAIAEHEHGGSPVDIRQQIADLLSEHGGFPIRMVGDDPVMVLPDKAIRLGVSESDIEGENVTHMDIEELSGDQRKDILAAMDPDQLTEDLIEVIAEQPDWDARRGIVSVLQGTEIELVDLFEYMLEEENFSAEEINAALSEAAGD